MNLGSGSERLEPVGLINTGPNICSEFGRMMRSIVAIFCHENRKIVQQFSIFYTASIAACIMAQAHTEKFK